jgi:hypothetical protein
MKSMPRVLNYKRSEHIEKPSLKSRTTSPKIMPRILDAGLNNIGICALNIGWN